MRSSQISRFGLRLSFLAVLISLTTACNTLMEVTTPGDSSLEYRESKNSEGETIYVRERDASSGWPEPMPTPLPTPLPLSPVLSASAFTTPVTPSPTPASASATVSSSTEDMLIRPGIEAAFTAGHAHLGLHAGFNESPYFEPRIGGSIFVSKDLYAGLDLSLRIRLPAGDLKPFFGLGAYVGDTKECSESSSAQTGRAEEICVKKFLSAGYVEGGLEYGHFSIFVRDYRLTRAGLSVPTKTFFGLGLRF